MSSSESAIGKAFSIAGVRTNIQWLEESDGLLAGKELDRWEALFKNYFLERLRTRYLEPIRRIQENDTEIGEGFSIVAIQCSLIEFLQTTIEGSNYIKKPKKKDNKRKETYEYSSGESRDIFTTFLQKEEPFASFFSKPDLADDFYDYVRCSILHEARTSDGWLIWADSVYKRPCFKWVKQEQSNTHIIQIHTEPRLIHEARKTLYRNDFTAALWRFIENYGERLRNDTALQEAFKRKFDALATT